MGKNKLTDLSKINLIENHSVKSISEPRHKVLISLKFYQKKKLTFVSGHFAFTSEDKDITISQEWKDANNSRYWVT